MQTLTDSQVAYVHLINSLHNNCQSSQQMLKRNSRECWITTTPYTNKKHQLFHKTKQVYFWPWKLLQNKAFTQTSAPESFVSMKS
jgi:hypothetical protein